MSTITNPNDSQHVATVMRLVADTLSVDNADPDSTVYRQVPGDKSSILVEIIIGLGVAATWDAIKYCMHRIGELVFKEDDVISVDGEERHLGELAPKSGVDPK